MAGWKKVVVESSAGNISQNAATATSAVNATNASQLSSTRTFAVGGDLTGTVDSNLSSGFTISATINDNAVDAAAIAAGAVGASELATNAVETDKIKDANVTADKLASNAVTNAKIAANAVTSAKIQDGTIEEGDLKISNAAQNGYILSSDGTTGFTWIANTVAANDSTITFTAGTGIASIGDGSFTLNQSSNESFEIGVTGVLEDLVTLGAPTADGQFVVATGSGAFAYESGNTARTSLGLGTGNSPQFTNLTISGDLTVNGTTTTLDTTNLIVEDKLIKIADTLTPTTTTADGAGIQVESSGTEAEWPEFKWSKDANLTGWQLSDHNATSSTMFEVSVMQFGTDAPSSPAIETEAGAGAFFADTTNGNLYLYI